MASLIEQLNLLTRSAWVMSNDQLLRKQSQLVRLLIQRGKRNKKTGAKLEFGLRIKRPTVKRLSHALDTYPQAGGETHKVGSLDWANYVVGLQITGLELRAQHGINIQQLLKRPNLAALSSDQREVLMSIIDGQIAEGQEALAEQIGTDIYSHRGTGGGITGLPAIIDDSQTDYAGIAYNAANIETDDKAGSTTYWEPYVSTNSGTLRDITLELLGILINRVRRGGEKPEDVVAVLDWDLFTELEIMLQASKDYVGSKDSALAQIGFQAFEWRHVSFMPDERAPANKIYALNLNNLWLQIRPSADLNNFEGWTQNGGPGGQDAAYGPIHPELQLICNDRHRMGLLGDVKGNSD